jgi:hypothetical protein
MPILRLELYDAAVSRVHDLVQLDILGPQHTVQFLRFNGPGAIEVHLGKEPLDHILRRNHARRVKHLSELGTLDLAALVRIKLAEQIDDARERLPKRIAQRVPQELFAAHEAGAVAVVLAEESVRRRLRHRLAVPKIGETREQAELRERETKLREADFAAPVRVPGTEEVGNVLQRRGQPVP